MTKAEHAAALARCKELKLFIESHDILSNLPDKWAFRAVVDLPSALDMLERAMYELKIVKQIYPDDYDDDSVLVELLREWEVPDAE